MPEGSLSFDEARDALNKLFSDTSQPMEDTLEDLRALQSEISDLISMLREDLKRRDE